MKNRYLTSMPDLLLPVIFFILVTIALTFNILSTSGLIIGDNFYWNKATITDVLGPRIIRESFLGDISILSTFKNGFLFPLAWMLNAASIPITIIYPFLFYFFSMLSFYALSAEFLKNKSLRIIVSVMYVVNPVTPYYFTSMLSAFVIIFLPLALKFLAKTLRQSTEKITYFSGNFALFSFFLALSISAHEQFITTAGVIALFAIIAFVFVSYRQLGLTRKLGKIALGNILLFVAIVLLVNLPLILSVRNISSAPLSTYFTGRFHEFLSNVDFSYHTVDPLTLLRFGGDSGVGLGQTAWYDSYIITNLFGYSLVIAIFASAYLLFKPKNKVSSDRVFFVTTFLLYIVTLLLIVFVKYLPNNEALAERLFGLPLQTWESPSKLRMLLLLSGLATSLFAFKIFENRAQTFKHKIIPIALIALIVGSFVIYNSTWAVNYAGSTPITPIAENLQWGDPFDVQYSTLADFLEKTYPSERGIPFPYTHKAELYVPPNFRAFQLVSVVNEKTMKLTEGHTSWSKTLGLFSIKHLAFNHNPDSNEIPLFPASFEGDTSNLAEEVGGDPGFRLQGEVGNFTIYENENALPMAYASNYYILYNSLDALKYTFDFVDFKNLPVFISAGEQSSKLFVPSFIKPATYTLYALSWPNVSTSNLPLIASNGEVTHSLNLNKVSASNYVDVFSADSTLNPGDVINVPQSDGQSSTERLTDAILNSTSSSLGKYGNFEMNFTVNILKAGPYSFTGPRVLIDTGLTKYYLIFHDNGNVELATMENEVFTSGVKVNNAYYNLKDDQNSIDVSISRIFDKFTVNVNGEPQFSFSIDPGVAEVFLSSELSISRFTKIDVTELNVLYIFAVRQVSNQISYVVQQSSPERSILDVMSNGSDYAVVVQYLNTPLRNIDSKANATAIQVNSLFSGWILNPAENNSERTHLTIGIPNSDLTLSLTYVSIAFVWSALILTVSIVVKRKRLSWFQSFSIKVKHLKKQDGR